MNLFPIILLVYSSCFISLSKQGTNPFDQCLYVESSVCVNSQKAVYGKDNKLESVIGLWTFDDKFAADHSGLKNFIDQAPKVGPASGGRGYSAFFNGTDMSIIQHIPEYEAHEMTISFSVFLLPGNMDGWRTLVYKGGSSQEMTPSVLLWPKDTRLHVRVSTDKFVNEGLDSVSAIPLRKWTQITISYSRQLLQLFINGMLDSQTILQGHLKVNSGPFYIGKDPYHAGAACYIDNLRFIKGKAKESYLMAEASAPLYVAEGKYYTKIGCSSCNYNEALNSSPEGYHLCSLQELYSGGYHTARSFDWFKNNIDVWYRVNELTQTLQVAEQMLDPNVFKLGLCCVI